jgi:hypothetical protein
VKSKTASSEELINLRDFTALFLSLIYYLQDQYETCVKVLDESTNHTAVLDQEHFALTSLLKARAQIKLKQFTNGLETLNRRHNQESLYKQVQVSKEKEKKSTYNVTSIPSKKFIDLQNPKTAVNHCKRLHLLLLSSLQGGDQAVLLFTEIAPGSSVEDAKEFIKKHFKSIETSGDDLLLKYKPDFNRLIRKL